MFVETPKIVLKANTNDPNNDVKSMSSLSRHRISF